MFLRINVGHTCNPSTLEPKAGGLQVWGQPGICSEIMSQKKKIFFEQTSRLLHVGFVWILNIIILNSCHLPWWLWNSISQSCRIPWRHPMGRLCQPGFESSLQSAWSNFQLLHSGKKPGGVWPTQSWVKVLAILCSSTCMCWALTQAWARY
jgi:hypothetical protein